MCRARCWQIALYPPGAEALRSSPEPVLQSLHTLQAQAWTPEAQRSAEVALALLSAAKAAGAADKGQHSTAALDVDHEQHVMVSCARIA